MAFDRKSVRHILVIRRKHIGDMICAIPALKTLRSEFPEARITVVADILNAGILESASYIDQVLVYNPADGFLGNKYFAAWKLFRKAGLPPLDLAIALKTKYSSVLALMTWLSGARIRIGCLPKKRHILQRCFNAPIVQQQAWSDMNIVDGLLAFLEEAGIGNGVRDVTLNIPEAATSRISGMLSSAGVTTRPVVLLNVSSNKPENTWPTEHLGAFGKRLIREYGAAIVVAATPADRNRAVAVANAIGNATVIIPDSIMDFAALATASDLLICSEGGSMHVGAAAGTPTISLWGKKRPKKWAPVGDRQFVVTKGDHVNSIQPEDVLDLIAQEHLLAAESGRR